MPGKETAKLKAGEDIRKSQGFFLLRELYIDYLNLDINWTGRGGNVSASTYTA